MTNINELGKVYTSDVLIVGGGISGLATAIKAKKINPDLNILVVEKGHAGFSGQATRAGHGIRHNIEGKPLDEMIEYLVKSHTPYMNDQEFLAGYVERCTESAQFLMDCGVEVGKNPDGTLWSVPVSGGQWAMGGIDITVVESLRKFALKLGIRILSRVNIFELLTSKEEGRAIGAIGFDMDHGECRIFHAKTVCISTHGAHFKKMGKMFMGYATGVGAAYRAGAVLRNLEFSLQPDIIFTQNGLPVYGAYNLIHNNKGENISKKYNPIDDIEGVSAELVLGMKKEVEEGRGPIYSDLENPDLLYKIVSASEPEPCPRVLPSKFAWHELVEKKTEKYRGNPGLKPETTVNLDIQVEPLRVDRKYRTDVPGLFASGKVTCNGSAYFGWSHGDGIGNAAITSLFAGESIAEYAKDADLPDLDYEQVAKYKEKIYAPLNRPTKLHPNEIFDHIELYGYDIDIALNKSQESINKVLKDVEKMKEMLPELTADDPHTLAKCHEVADSVLVLEMVFRAADMRKESRGIQYPHIRSDYPERDDKNWLKWINFKNGKNGEMEIFTEDIPMWRYPYRPEGYEIPEGQVEEYYV